MSKKVLFINYKKTQCSIWESGFMAYCALKNYSVNALEYLEISESSQYSIPDGFDVYLFNYHYTATKWFDFNLLSRLNGLKATLVLEVSPQNAMALCPDDIFDAYLVLDPTHIPIKPTHHTFPRPLEEYIPAKKGFVGKTPLIGSFGFPTRGKNFDKLVEAVGKEFDRAVVRINLPDGDFVLQSKERVAAITQECHAAAKPGIKVIITHDYLDKQELVNWCAENTLNCFMYERPGLPGLAATTDQAILAGKPLAVSGDQTFRHVHQYIKPYPEWTLKESIEKSPEGVERMAKDWHPREFAKKFDQMLLDYQDAGFFAKRSTNDFFEASSDLEKTLLKELSHSAKISFSQSGEDQIIAYLFSMAGNSTPSYIDIGANHPFFMSNTYYFYQKGSCGVCIEPNPDLHKLISVARPRDICLNYALGPSLGTSELHVFSGLYDGVSTFLKEEAERWVKRGAPEPKAIKIKMFTLDIIIDHFLKKIPDFVSMDIEGMELSILSGFDFEKYPIPCFCIETLRYLDDGIYTDQDIVNFMLEKGYIHHASTKINSIFVREELLARWHKI